MSTMKPAEIVLKEFSVHELAQALEVYPTNIMRWVRSVKQGGTGGYIPTRHLAKVYRMARRRGITAHALIVGR